MRDFHFESGTHIKSNDSTRRMMMHLLIALLPIIIFSFYKNGIIPYQEGYVGIYGLFKPLLMIILAAGTGFIAEIGYYHFINQGKKLKDFMKDSYGFIPGIFLALVLPLNTPLIIVVIGALVASIIGKMLFGGFGNNIFNPALIGRLFVVFIYGITIYNNGGYLNAYEVDTIAKATPLTNGGLANGIGTYQTLVAPYGNLWNFFLGTIPGSLGETSTLLILIAFIYLAINKVIKLAIPIAYVVTVFVMTYLIGHYNGLGLWYPMFQILSGGLMFGAVFMATDPVTSPVTPIGQILYGLFLGILTVTFRFLTPEPEGVLTSILVMNLFVFVIDKVGIKSRFKFRSAVIPFVMAWILIFGLGMYISTTFKVVDTDFAIISKDKTGTTTTYVATQKGYISTIKAKVVISDNQVTTYTVIEQGDSFYQMIIDSDYLNKLLEEQTSLEDADTVSGATFSSAAYKQLLINVLNDYKGK